MDNVQYVSLVWHRKIVKRITFREWQKKIISKQTHTFCNGMYFISRCFAYLLKVCFFRSPASHSICYHWKNNFPLRRLPPSVKRRWLVKLSSFFYIMKVTNCFSVISFMQGNPIIPSKVEAFRLRCLLFTLSRLSNIKEGCRLINALL